MSFATTFSAEPIVTHSQNGSRISGSCDTSTVNVADFGVYPDVNLDAVLGLQLALAACREKGAHTLIFPTGRYDFRSARAPEEFVFISNNDEGLRRIAFPIQRMRDLTIDGQGSEFIFHDVIIPFMLDKSQGVTLKNFIIDWATTFHTEGRVKTSDENGIELEISPQFPYRVVNGRFQSLGPSREGWRLSNMLEFDSAKRETAFQASDNYEAEDVFRITQINDHCIRIAGAFTNPRPTPGNIMMLADHRRMCPAVFINETAGVIIENITIHHAGAMGIVAQRSANLRIEAVQVTPRPGSGRMISTTADATHFVSCRGKIELIDCVFENQVDDATNVHGIYTKITGFPDPRSVELQLVHHQQTGKHPAEVGHEMQFVSNETLLPIYQATVTCVERINKDHSILHFAHDLPDFLREGDALMDLYWQPTETVIRGCKISGNRARGVLVSVGGNILIENCNFHAPGAAVLIEGDANYWFESGPVSNAIIRNNVFRECNYGPWGKATIQISPGIALLLEENPCYHRNIQIINNHFVSLCPTLVDAKCVEKLIFKGNTITNSKAYAALPIADPFRIAACRETEIEEPSVI